MKVICPNCDKEYYCTDEDYPNHIYCPKCGRKPDGELVENVPYEER